MKSKLRIISFFLIILISLALLGCSQTGERKIEDSLKKRLGSSFHGTVDYTYHQKYHLGRISFKMPDKSGNDYVATWYYNVITDDNIVRISTFQVPKKFLELLFDQYPDTFIQDVETFQRLKKLKDSVDYVTDCMNREIGWAQKNIVSWDSVESQGMLANVVIELYDSAYSAAPLHITDEFPQPIKEFLLTDDPSYYAEYVAIDLRDWRDASRDKPYKEQ